MEDIVRQRTSFDKDWVERGSFTTFIDMQKYLFEEENLELPFQ